MSKLLFIYGQYLPEATAKISVFNRGFLLADGIYELVPVIWGQRIDVEQRALTLKEAYACV